MSDPETTKDAALALKCLACGAITTIVAGPQELCDRINELEALVDDLGTDPNPDSEEPIDAIKRHHAKAWEWARIANEAALEVRVLKEEVARLNGKVHELVLSLV